MRKLKILFIDIETAPLLGFFWHPKVRYISPGALYADSFMLSWAGKWYDDDTMHSDKVTSREAKKQTDKRIVGTLAKLVREADVVVAHNGDRFDIARLNARLMFWQLEPLGPVQSIDTLKLAKASFSLPYYSQQYLCEFLGIGSKIKTDFDLWLECYHGDKAALAEMLEYNKHDVVLLEEMFERMKPYVKTLRRLVDATTPEERICPFCGEDARIKRGTQRTQASNFQTMQCTACNRYSRGRRSDKIKLDSVPL